MFKQLGEVDQSVSVAFADYIRDMEGLGHKIVKLQTGDPEYITHESIVDKAKEALDHGETKYCNSRGLPELREAIAAKLKTKNGIDCSAVKNILITHGAVHAINIAIRSILNVGDECIVLEPYWRCYENDVILAGGKPVIVSLDPENGFNLWADQIIDSFTAKTKLIIVNTPNNPSGAVYSRYELDRLAMAASSKDIYIISDEVYEEFVYEEKRHYSIASNKEFFPWVISVFSFSKSYSMTGWRIGYLVASELLIKSILKLSQFSITSLAPFTQFAGLAALTDKSSSVYVEQMRLEYETKRNFIMKYIKGTALEGLCFCPDGAFYSLIDVSQLRLGSLKIAQGLVMARKIALTPGIAFGDNMDGYLRLSMTTSLDNIKKALVALIEVVNEPVIIRSCASEHFDPDE